VPHKAHTKNSFVIIFSWVFLQYVLGLKILLMLLLRVMGLKHDVHMIYRRLYEALNFLCLACNQLWKLLQPCYIAKLVSLWQHFAVGGFVQGVILSYKN